MSDTNCSGRKEDYKLAALNYFKIDINDTDYKTCMMCYGVVPADPGSTARLIAAPCGHSFCETCMKNVTDRDVKLCLTKCFTRRTQTDYIAANHKTLTEINIKNTNFVISKSVLAIVDCELDVLKHIISCAPDELDIDCEHKNVDKFVNRDGSFLRMTWASLDSGNLISIAEYHAKKEQDVVKKQEREHIVTFLIKSLIERYNGNNSLTKITEVLDKIISKNNKELINFFIETIKDNKDFKNPEAQIAILTKLSEYTDLTTQEQLFKVLNINLDDKDTAKALLPLYHHQQHWPIINKLISTIGINCLTDFPVRSMVKNGNLEDIKLLTNAGYNPVAQDKNGMTIMHYLLNLDEKDKEIAVDADLLSFFIDRGCDISQAYTTGEANNQKPFFIPLAIKSIIEKDEKLFSLILDTLYQSKSFVQITWFSYMVFKTLEHGNYDFFYMLTKHKISHENLFFNTTMTIDGESYSMLSYIAKLGNAELTEYVVSYDIKQLGQPIQASYINFLAEFSGEIKEALFVASQHGYTQVMKILIDNGANKNTESKYNYSDEAPIHAAAKNGHSDAVMLLLASPGVNINLKTNDKKTAYDYFLAHFNYYDNEGNFDVEKAKEHHSIKNLHCLLSFAIASGDDKIATQLLKDKDILSYEGEYQYLPLALLTTNKCNLEEDLILRLINNHTNIIDVKLNNLKGKKQLLFVELFKYAMKINNMKIAKLIIDKITAYDNFLTSFNCYDDEGNFDREKAKENHSITDLRCLLSFAIANGDNNIASQLLKDKDIMCYEDEDQYLPLIVLITTNDCNLREDLIFSLIESYLSIDINIKFIDFEKNNKSLFIELFKYAVKLNNIDIAKLIIDRNKEKIPSLLSTATFHDRSLILEFIAKNYASSLEILNILADAISSIPLDIRENDIFKDSLEKASKKLS